MNGTVDEVLQSVLIGTHLFRFVSGRWITATVMILQSTAKTMTRVIRRITADGSQFESRILTGENGKEKPPTEVTVLSAASVKAHSDYIRYF